MAKRHKRKIDKPIRKLKKSTFLIGLAVGLAFSIVIGVTGGAIGLGSIYPQLNQIAEPLVCPGTTMSYSRRVSEIGTATYYTAEWFCVDERSGVRTEVESNAVYIYCGLVYGLVFFGILLVIAYLYWNSSIGPAKNGGPKLW